MTIAGSCIGIEIDESVIRAAILSGNADRIVGYAEVKRSQKPGNEIEKLTLELQNLWNKLPEKFTGNVRVAAAVGVEDSGVRSEDNTEVWIDALEVKRSGPIDRVTYGSGYEYAPEDQLEQLCSAFFNNEIPLERIELAPVAAVRVLPQHGSFNFSVGSGIWWESTVRNGLVLSAEQATIDSYDRALYLSEFPGHEERIDNLGEISVSDDLLTAFNINHAHLAVSVGAAIGLQTNEPAFGATVVDQTQALEIQLDNSPVFDQSLLVEPEELDATFESEGSQSVEETFDVSALQDYATDQSIQTIATTGLITDVLIDAPQAKTSEEFSDEDLLDGRPEPLTEPVQTLEEAEDAHAIMDGDIQLTEEIKIISEESTEGEWFAETTLEPIEIQEIDLRDQPGLPPVTQRISSPSPTRSAKSPAEKALGTVIYVVIGVLAVIGAFEVLQVIGALNFLGN